MMWMKKKLNDGDIAPLSAIDDKIDNLQDESRREAFKTQQALALIEFIERNNVECDGDYIFLYKAIAKDGTCLHSSKKFKYEIGQEYVEDVDLDLAEECAAGLHASTLDYAISFGKESGTWRSAVIGSAINMSQINDSMFGWAQKLRTSDRYVMGRKPVINPSDRLFREPIFRIVKVKIHKDDVLIPDNCKEKLRCSKFLVVEEVELKHDIKFKVTDIKLDNSADITHRLKYEVRVWNNIIDESDIDIQFCSSIPLGQESISGYVSNQIGLMQGIYDSYVNGQGSLSKDDINYRLESFGCKKV